MGVKKGTILRQKVKVIEGPVLDVKYDADAGTFQYLIGHKSEDGEPTQTWLDEGAVEEPPKADAKGAK